MNYVIGVDIGTQSTKALLCDATGAIVAQQVRSYRPDTPQPLWAEQWPQVWVDAVMECIAGCVTDAGAASSAFSAAHVRAICISGLYGGSGIPVDADVQPLHPCLIWMDRRATDEVEWVGANVDMDRLTRITGNGVDSYYGFTKMLWLKYHRPEVWSRTSHFLPPNAFVIQRLTGVIAVDRSSAGNIGGVFDLETGTWSGEMLDALGIPRSMMPERLVACSAIVGGLTGDAATRLGLAQGTPVIAGGVDAAMATFAAGVTRPGQHVAMIGSSMCWGFISHQVDARHGLVSMPHVFGGARDTYVFGGAITAGAAVTWFREQFCQEDAASALTSGLDVHDVLEAGASRVPEGAEGLLFLPYLMGERSPVWDGKASGAFVGLTLFHRRDHLYRAVLEGVTFALRHNIEAGARGAAALDKAVIVVGGAAHSDLWMQIIADVTGRPVLTIAQEVEAAMGSALLAAYGVGLVSAEEAQRGWVTLVPRATPRPQAVAMYDALFDAYKALYPALKKTMHDLHDEAAARRSLPSADEHRTTKAAIQS
ncbi:MAG: FGGY-family carbohydrate kinase [Pseudomonadota bacterium]|nr:FGGY-family carbohydrate kinase [Pseudomonadota bacterium]